MILINEEVVLQLYYILKCISHRLARLFDARPEEIDDGHSRLSAVAYFGIKWCPALTSRSI